MLPSAKSSLIKGGFSPKAASWILIGLFLGGALGIQVVSRVLHHYIPSHVVDCDHTHEDDKEAQEHDHDHRPEITKRNSTSNSSYETFPPKLTDPSASRDPLETDGRPGTLERRSSFTSIVSQLVSTKKALCDVDGACYGYTDPCGQDCFKIVQARGGSKLSRGSRPPLSRSASTPRTTADNERQPLLLLQDVEEEEPLKLQTPGPGDFHHAYQQPENSGYSSTSTMQGNGHHYKPLERPTSSSSFGSGIHHPEHHKYSPSEHHHHHVPTNAFLSIGLQTSVAIALHKLPEGFITYATNHANPKLGVSVFLALFIHNITEGFAMALPLYLAVNSRGKAMIWSALLGGVSQPLGAAVAALWFKLAGSQAGNEPGEGVYGGMFAIVAGIMASVALLLFSESLDMTHNKNLCIIFAFVGMAILGISGALTA
jgi:zinc transporter, ZIP family